MRSTHSLLFVAPDKARSAADPGPRAAAVVCPWTRRPGQLLFAIGPFGFTREERVNGVGRASLGRGGEKGKDAP